MKSRATQLFSVLSCAILVQACGGGGDDSNESVFVADPNPEVAFFNDDSQTELQSHLTAVTVDRLISQ